MTAPTPSPSEENLDKARRIAHDAVRGYFDTPVTIVDRFTQLTAAALAEKEAEVGRLQNSAMFRRIELQKERIATLEAALRELIVELEKWEHSSNSCIKNSANDHRSSSYVCGICLARTALSPAPAKPEPGGMIECEEGCCEDLADEGKREAT